MIYFPPFKNVRLVEAKDFIELVPVATYREFFGYGKMKARDLRPGERKGPL